MNSHELMAGDVIVGVDGSHRRISRIEQRYEESFPVSNLSIGEYHNYAVGRYSILVHNDVICEEGVYTLRQIIAEGASMDEIREIVRGFDNADDVLRILLPKGSVNPAVQRAAARGSRLHSDKPGHLPDQLRNRYPDTEFEFTKPGVAGQDVKVVGGKHPSDYADSNWAKGVNHGDFKPDTASGAKTFVSDQRNKWKEITHKLPYNQGSGKLN